MVAGNSGEKVCTFVEFSRSVAPGAWRESKSQKMVCLLQSLLKIRPSVFAGMRHKVDDCAIVALNKDAGRA